MSLPPWVGALPRMDIEFLAVREGVKPAMRQMLSPEHLPGFLRRCDQAGLRVQVCVGEAGVSDERGFIYGRVGERIAVAGKDVAAVAAVVEVEERLLADDRPAEPLMLELERSEGLALGFPSCCVEAYLGSRDKSNRALLAGALGRSTRFAGLLNPLCPSLASFVSFFPCRFDCEAALLVGEQIQAVAQAHQPQATEAWLDLLCREWHYMDERRMYAAFVQDSGGKLYLTPQQVRSGTAEALGELPGGEYLLLPFSR